jgi:hypothetical protein
MVLRLEQLTKLGSHVHLEDKNRLAAPKYELLRQMSGTEQTETIKTTGNP